VLKQMTLSLAGTDETVGLTLTLSWEERGLGLRERPFPHAFLSPRVPQGEVR